MTLAGRLSFAQTGDARHDQCSQGTSAHVPGAVGGPLGLVRSPATFLPHHAVAAVARVARPAGRTASQAGAEGTKQLLAQYGDRLICVRYRYDARRKKRLKTVEFVVAERDCEPRRPPFAETRSSAYASHSPTSLAATG